MKEDNLKKSVVVTNADKYEKNKESDDQNKQKEKKNKDNKGIFWVILWEMMNFLQKKVMRNNSECRSCVVLVHVVWQIKGVYA